MSVWSVVEPLTLDFNIAVPVKSIKTQNQSKSIRSRSISTLSRADIELQVKQFVEIEKIPLDQVTHRLGISLTSVRRVCRTLKIGKYSVAEGAIVSRSSQAPFGWDVVHGQLQFNEMEWPWVQEIYRLHLSGTSMHKIAATLVDQNVPTKNGGRWFAKTISQILKFNRPHLDKQKSKRRKYGT